MSQLIKWWRGGCTSASQQLRVAYLYILILFWQVLVYWPEIEKEKQLYYLAEETWNIILTRMMIVFDMTGLKN